MFWKQLLKSVLPPFHLSSIIETSKSNCPSLPKLQHGYYKTLAKKAPHTVEFHCKNSYVLSGNPRRSCLADGTWSGKQPRCVRGMVISTFLCPLKVSWISVLRKMHIITLEYILSLSGAQSVKTCEAEDSPTSRCFEVRTRPVCKL